ncbi:MAG: asparagine synthase (glutamine-hydrolyzing) [Pirellulales bacterium]|nr:asparagine synthase (glutamine-hydrolyzing) [Pirellulales bacterium]
MSGIAGILDLDGQRPIPDGILDRMAGAMRHRGPDGEARTVEPGLGLVLRRLRIVGLQTASPLPAGEDGNVAAVFDGALSNAPQLRDRLEARGHHIAGTADEELLPHLWEEHGEQLFEHLRGQFALAVWDRRRRRLVLARDRFGVCPVHWTRQGDWLVFASEIKVLLASGLVDPQPELRGISQIFTFFGLPGPLTCFKGVYSLLPGRFLPVDQGRKTEVRDATYWEMDFPDRGQEEDGSETELVDRYDALLLEAVRRRLRADVPVAAYSSGGLDSSMIVAMARHIRGEPLDTFTFQIEHPHLRESAGAEIVAQHVGTSAPTVVNCTPSEILGTFPRLVQAAESPVIDTSAAALFRLAEAAHAADRKIVLTGEGADEWQAGYPWFRIDKKLGYLDLVPGLALNRRAFWRYLQIRHLPSYPWSIVARSEELAAGHNAWLLVYHLMSTTKARFFSREMLDAVGDYLPYEDLALNRDRMRRWHPLNRSIYTGAKVHLGGLHLTTRGDRSAMHAAVQPRYPFLDEDLFQFLARIHPRWKMRGLVDKYLQRRLADRWLPPAVTAGRKRLLHAPLDAFHEAPIPPLVEKLLSESSLRKAGYFDPKAVNQWRNQFRSIGKSFRRLFIEMGLVGVISTQLWHYAYFDSSLADEPLPGVSP